MVIDMEEEFILVGTEYEHEGKKQLNHTVYPLKKPDEYDMKPFQVGQRFLNLGELYSRT